MQREALRNLSKWNHDETNPRMFRVQDKGARLFIEWKERYRSKVEDYLEDIDSWLMVVFLLTLYIYIY